MSDTFAPNPQQITTLFDALSNPARSLQGIAQDLKTSVEALANWLAQEDIQQRLQKIEQAFANRVRLVALQLLPTAADTLATALRHARAEESAPIPGATPTQAADLRRRARETIAKLAKTLQTMAPLAQPKPKSAPQRAAA